MKTNLKAILTAIVLIAGLALHASAADTSIDTTGYRIEENGVNVTMDGWIYEGEVYKVNNTAYAARSAFPEKKRLPAGRPVHT